MASLREFVIRALGYRINPGYVSFLLVALIIGLIGDISAHHWGEVAVGAVAMVVFIRCLMMSIRTSDTEIVVTNFVRTHHIPWASIGSFSVGSFLAAPVVTIVWPDLTELNALGTYLPGRQWGQFRRTSKRYLKDEWMCSRLNAELQQRAPGTPGTPRDPTWTGAHAFPILQDPPPQ